MANPRKTDDDRSLSAGEAALEQLRPRYMALAADDVARPSLDLRAASLAALGVALRLKTPALRARFEALAASGQWKLSHLDDLESLARAAWFVRHRIDAAAATRSEAQVPAKTVNDGTAVRARMRKVTEFHYDDDEKLGPLLAYLRKGTGYQDLADDLVGYAEVYKAKRAEIEATPRHYRATDHAAALRLANEILGHLGLAGTHELDALADLAARAFTLLLASYDEVCAAGRFLERANPDVERLYPSLWAVARGGGRASRDEPEDDRPAPSPAPTPQ